MKLVFVGPGIMPIPPTGWGAVEILIWDYKCIIEKIYGNDVHIDIINTPYKQQIIYDVNTLNPDIVHIHYDVFWDIVPYIKCKTVILTSHYGYIESKNWFPGYYPIFDGFVNSTAHIHCLSNRVYDIYKNAGVVPNRLFTITNGANDELFQFTNTPTFANKSIYLGKIEPRKKQALYQNIQNIDFIGEVHDCAFNANNSNYLGKWSKDDVYNKLSHYGNLVLLSDGEVHPLVVCEALICGLGVVVSEAASANLDLSKSFISVIPDYKLDDLEYITNIVEYNRMICNKPNMRDTIRTYGLNNFSYNKIVSSYIEKLKDICNN